MCGLRVVMYTIHKNISHDKNSSVRNQLGRRANKQLLGTLVQ